MRDLTSFDRSSSLLLSLSSHPRFLSPSLFLREFQTDKQRNKILQFLLFMWNSA